MSQNPTLRRGSSRDIPLLRDLWVTLHDHHRRVMPELSPYVSDEDSWQVRAALYRDLLSRPAGVVLLAEDGASLLGYALGVVLAPDESAWLDDTWQSGGPVGEVESLVVRPDQRARGIGTALLRRLESELAHLGAVDLVLGVLPGNVGAVRLYESLSYRPTYLHLRKTGVAEPASEHAAHVVPDA